MTYEFTTREWFLIDDMANGTGMTPEQGVAEADKHSFIGKIQRHHELKKKVDQTWKDAADAEKRGDTKGANRAFNKHVRYTNLERPGTWTTVKEQFFIRPE